jgi:hypothetical protein
MPNGTSINLEGMPGVDLTISCPILDTKPWLKVGLKPVWLPCKEVTAADIILEYRNTSIVHNTGIQILYQYCKVSPNFRIVMGRQSQLICNLHKINYIKFCSTLDCCFYILYSSTIFIFCRNQNEANEPQFNTLKRKLIDSDTPDILFAVFLMESAATSHGSSKSNKRQWNLGLISVF